MTHPYTRIVFRVGDDASKKLGDGFSFFESQDVRNLETGQAIVRVERSDFDFNLSVPPASTPASEEAAARRLEVITASRRKYATARADVEAVLARARGNERSPHVGDKTAAAREAQPAAAAPIAPPRPIQPSHAVVEVAKSQPASEPPKFPPPRDLGRGGSQHQAVQKRIKE